MQPMQTLEPALEALAHEVIGAAIEVHRTLGPGYLESVYQNALSHELTLRSLEHACQARVGVNYKGKDVGEGVIDILVRGQIIVELKCVEALHPIHEAQLHSYLNATGLGLGYLMNFKSLTLKDGLRRIIH